MYINVCILLNSNLATRKKCHKTGGHGKGGSKTRYAKQYYNICVFFTLLLHYSI